VVVARRFRTVGRCWLVIICSGPDGNAHRPQDSEPLLLPLFGNSERGRSESPSRPRPASRPTPTTPSIVAQPHTTGALSYTTRQGTTHAHQTHDQSCGTCRAEPTSMQGTGRARPCQPQLSPQRAPSRRPHRESVVVFLLFVSCVLSSYFTFFRRPSSRFTAAITSFGTDVFNKGNLSSFSLALS
jgi:hypothetical protein